MRKADKKRQLLPGMTPSTKVRWAAKGKTVYAETTAGLPDYTKPTGFEVERWGFYYKSHPDNKIVWLEGSDLSYLGRREEKPTSNEDQEVAFAYCLFKCLTHSDGQAYTRERANKSWFIRFSVEVGFTPAEAEAALYNRDQWSGIVYMCKALAAHAGIEDFPITEISRDIPSQHKMQDAKKVPFAQLILNRMSKHKDTRFRDIDKEA